MAVKNKSTSKPPAGMATTMTKIANMLPKLDKTALTKTVMPKIATVLPMLLWIAQQVMKKTVLMLIK